MSAALRFAKLPPKPMAARRREPLITYDVHAGERLEVPAGRALRLAVTADTHSSPHPRSLEAIASRRPDAILLAGDIGAMRVVDELGSIAPVIFVRGNIDPRGPDMPESVDIDIETPTERLMRFLLLHIGVAGPRLRADARRMAQRSQAGLVICGHSHIPFLGDDRGIYVFNPGSMGPRRFHLPITFGMLEVSKDALSMHHVDCETGERWVPPGAAL